MAFPARLYAANHTPEVAKAMKVMMPVWMEVHWMKRSQQ
jgi:hypothetical protein